MTFLFWKILKTFFVPLLHNSKNFAGPSAKLNIEKKIFEKKKIIINFTQIIRICPEILHFLTYEIYYISLKYPKARA